jgi:fumarylpyruvate hydrolase
MSTSNVVYAFEPQSILTLLVVGSQKLFPVHRIYCVGRNFADHAIEVGHVSTQGRHMKRTGEI